VDLATKNVTAYHKNIAQARQEFLGKVIQNKFPTQYYLDKLGNWLHIDDMKVSNTEKPQIFSQTNLHSTIMTKIFNAAQVKLQQEVDIIWQDKDIFIWIRKNNVIGYSEIQNPYQFITLEDFIQQILPSPKYDNPAKPGSQSDNTTTLPYPIATILVAY